MSSRDPLNQPINSCVFLLIFPVHDSGTEGRDPHIFSAAPAQGFLALTFVGAGGRVSLFAVGGCPVSYRMLSSIPGLYAPDASGVPLTLVLITKNVCRHCQMSPWGKQPPCLRITVPENHCRFCNFPASSLLLFPLPTTGKYQILFWPWTAHERVPIHLMAEGSTLSQSSVCTPVGTVCGLAVARKALANGGLPEDGCVRCQLSPPQARAASVTVFVLTQTQIMPFHFFFF